MMNETDVAAFEPVPVPTLVKPPSTHGLTPTGVMSIEQTSCKARRWPRIPFPSSTTYSPSSSSSSSPPSSQVAKTKTNRPEGCGGSAPSSSSLAKAAARKKRRTTADVAVVTSTIAATTATADELGAFRHKASEARWDHPFLPGSPSYGEVPDTNPGARDHFTLSSALAQTHQGPDVCYLPCSDPDPFTLNSSLSFPSSTFHTPVPFLTAHENLQYGHPSLTDYPTDYPDTTTQPFHSYVFNYPLYPALDPVNTPTMRVAGDVTYAGRQLPPESESLGLIKGESSSGESIEKGWQAVQKEPLEESNDPRHYDIVGPEVDHTSSDTNALLGGDSYVNVVPHLTYEVATDENRPSSHSEKRSRTCLDPEARRLTAQTRKLKACIRCRMQKIKCVPDPDDEGQDCMTCRRINLDSKKVIHRLQCLRWKLAEVVLFREGGLNLTKRWTGVKVKDLGPRDWASDRIRSIEVTLGYRKEPLELSVRKFKPHPSDVTCKHWVDKAGVKRSFNIEPYALASTHKTIEAYKGYVYRCAWAAVEEYSNNPRVHSVVRETYKAAMLYVMRLDNHPPEIRAEDVRPGDFLRQYFYLWFGIRNTLGSAFIVGEDKLDMKPVDDRECPYYQTISIPRMIPAQFDSLGYANVLAPKRKQVLEGLWKMMASKNPHHFFAIYLTVFMLLHEVSVTSADRLRRATDNKENRRYDLARFVEQLQEGANIVLSHWHYYKRNVNTWIMSVEFREKEEQKNVVWGELDPEEVQLLVRTQRAYKAKEAEARRSGPMTWEDDLYFVSQMFEEGWQPKPTFCS